MKKTLIFVLLLFFFSNCKKIVTEKKEEKSAVAISYSSLIEGTTQQLLNSLSEQMLKEDFSNLNLNLAYVHEFKSSDYYVYEIPLKEDFSSFVLASVNPNGRYEYGMIITVQPISLDNGFSGIIKYSSLDRQLDDILSYERSKITSYIQYRVIPSRSQESSDVVVTYCSCQSNTTHFLWLNIPDLLGFNEPGNNNYFGSAWSGGGSSYGGSGGVGSNSGSGLGGGVTVTGGIATTVDGIPISPTQNGAFAPGIVNAQPTPLLSEGFDIDDVDFIPVGTPRLIAHFDRKSS